MKTSLFLIGVLIFVGCNRSFIGNRAWKEVDLIVARIQAPVFVDKTFNIKDYGAIADGKTDARQAIQNAIEACHQAGGGRVLIPAGNYFCDGPIHLKSNINFYLEKGAVITFGVNPEKYTPLVKVRWEGTVCYNYSPLIYAYQQHNIAISGEGLLDGQADQFWHVWKRDNDGKNQDVDKPVLRQMGNDRVPEEQRIFGNGFYDANKNGVNDGDGKPHYLRPSLIEFYECNHILLENFTAKGSPFWTIHPVFCKNVTIRGLTIQKGTTNDDGIDPDSCEDVLIENCTIDTNDDPIAIKAGRDQDAWNRPGSKNIVIRNCNVSCEVGNGFCIGSEMSGGVENVFVENYSIKSTDNGINFKCNLDRGGFIQNIHLKNIEIDSCTKHGILFQMDYHGYRGGDYPPDFQNFTLQNIKIRKAGKIGIKIAGVERKPIKNVQMANIRIEDTPELKALTFVKNLKSKP